MLEASIVIYFHFQGYRSVFRDIEAQVVIATDNADLRARLHKVSDSFVSFFRSFIFLTGARTSV